MDFAQKANRNDPTAAIPGLQEFMASMKGTMGRVSGTLDVTDHGLAFWSSVELK